MAWNRLGLVVAAALVSLTCASAAWAADTCPSAWLRPALVDPARVTINDSERNLKLDQSKDYILQCRPGAVDLHWPLVVWGGHNVVFQDCHLEVRIANWAAQFKDQTGTLWIHDVHFGGVHLTGGVQLEEPGATVVMRDVLFDRVHGSYTTNHAECLQSWAGPARLLIDGLQCPTTYQGLFLLPNQWSRARAPNIFDLRHVAIDARQGAVALWIGDVNGGLRKMRLSLDHVYVAPNPTKTWRGWWLEPQPPSRAWHGVIAGMPPDGPYVHAIRTGASGVDEDVAPAELPGEQQ